MADIRFDPVANVWVVIARNRQARPMEFLQMETLQQQLLCPFCIGNEEETPLALAAYRDDGSLIAADDDGTGWTVRVVPNKYPTYEPKLDAPLLRGKPNRQKANGESPVPNPYRNSDLVGEQEVIVCSPRHIASMSELNDDELLVNFQAFQDRLRAFDEMESVQHSMLFLNCRSSAGASLSHLHAQLIGSPILSDELKQKVQRNTDSIAQTGRPLIEACAAWEVEQKSRIIYQSEHFLVLCPFASRYPFQVWLIPRHSQKKFSSCPSEMRDELARSCRWLISSIEKLVDQPGYNVLWHQAPRSMDDQDHWYVEIMPRLTRQAGFELGTNIWVNPVSPETAAKRLRFR